MINVIIIINVIIVVVVVVVIIIVIIVCLQYMKGAAVLARTLTVGIFLVK